MSETPRDLLQEQVDLLPHSLNVVAQGGILLLQPGQPLSDPLQLSVALTLGHQLRTVQSKPLDVKASGVGEGDQHLLFLVDVLRQEVALWV